MQQQLAKEPTNILDEGFEIPACTIDLQELIDKCNEIYNEMPKCRADTRSYKLKLNDLISELNERRNMHIYNYVK